MQSKKKANRMKILPIICYLISLAWLGSSIYILNNLSRLEGWEFNLSMSLFFFALAIFFSPNDSYIKLLFRKMVKNFKSHKENLKKELDDEQ